MSLKRTALAAWLVVLSSSAAAQFTFQALPGLGDSILKLSADGQTVAANLRIGGIDRAVRWTAASGAQTLGSLPGGDGSSLALGLSPDGRFVVGRARSARGFEAFVWSAAAGMQGLGDLPPANGGELHSWASGISADGQAVVGHSSSGSTWRAFRWTPGSGFTDLGSIGLGFSSAAAVSRDGSLVVGTSRSAAGQEAFRWTAAGGMQSLGGLVGGGLTQRAHALSADGQVIVGLGGHTSFQAFRWTAGGGAVQLGTFEPHNPGSSASAVSADGRVVVGMGSGVDADGNGEAFVWFPGRGILDLRRYLLDHGVGAVQGWRLSEATGVSDDGRTLLGWGIDPAGLRSAWLAHIDIDDFPVPPPPALPAAPGNLSGSATATQITLRWADNAGNETGYRVERCIGSGCTAFATAATLGPNATSFVDAQRGRGQVFRYRVRAFNAVSASAYSNVVSVVTPRR